MLSLLSNPYVLMTAAGIWLASLIGAGWAGHTVTHNAWEAAQAKVLEQQAAERVALETRLNEVSTAYEAAKGQRDVVTKVITKNVDRVVVRYADRACLDADGVRLVNDALSGKATPAGGPLGSVPGSLPAGGRVGSIGTP